MRDRTRRPEWRDVRPGLWLLAGIAAVVLAVFFLDEVRREIEEGPRLVVVTGAAPQLEAGSTVWVAGRPAGRVLSVRLREADASGAGPIVIQAVLEHEAAAALRDDASARVVQSGLLAPVVLSLAPGNPDRPPFDFADTLRGTAALVDRDRALARVDTLRTALAESRPLARRLRSELAEGEGTIAALRRDPAALVALEHRLRKLQDLLVGNPEDGTGGTLARMATDTSLSASLDRVRASVERLFATPDSARSPDRALRELLTALDGLEGSLVALERDLETGRGALGRGLYDTAILQQARLLRARMDSLSHQLLENPLRWLRFRLF